VSNLPDYRHSVRRTVLQHVTIRRTGLPALLLAVLPDYRHYDYPSQRTFGMMTVAPSSKPVFTYKCAVQIHREIYTFFWPHVSVVSVSDRQIFPHESVVKVHYPFATLLS
jgi:hypothetical protein